MVERLRFKKVVVDKSLRLKKKNKDLKFIAVVIGHYFNFGRHDLLWRKKINPYKILVSEIMLQQTQVVRVIPKFTLWMKQYSSLRKLSHANLKDLLLLWQGLGYQRRVKALYQISKISAIIPKTFRELEALPGIGVYTASAIMAFAYNVFDHPVLETNIRTALIEHYYKDAVTVDDQILLTKLFELTNYNEVQVLGARDWYYALMDYGSYLKKNKISHTSKNIYAVKQEPYKGSQRQVRAQVLFAIAHNNALPNDERVGIVLKQLLDEGFVIKNKTRYSIV
jgi:A/G-specific adenine glycosylase